MTPPLSPPSAAKDPLPPRRLWLWGVLGLALVALAVAAYFWPWARRQLTWFLSQAFGSDETISYTAEYTWNANQMAHVMMGFALATVWIRLAVARWERRHPPSASPDGADRRYRLLAPETRGLDVSVGLLFALIGLKDVIDYLMDRTAYASSAVPPDFGAVAFDSFTDVSFWYTGMFLAAIVIGGVFRRELRGTVRVVTPFVGLTACALFWLLHAAPVWLEQKRTFDQSGLPFNYTRLPRLATDDKDVRDRIASGASAEKLRLEGKVPLLADFGQWESVLKGFRERAAGPTRPTAEHYVILGGTPEQRSKVAVAMACEFAPSLRGPTPWATAWGKIHEEKPDAVEANERVEFDTLRLRRVKYVSAPAVMERPEAFNDDLHRKAIECVAIDDLDAAMRVADDTSTAGSATALSRFKKLEKLSPELAARLKLPSDFHQWTRDEREQFAIVEQFQDGGDDRHIAQQSRRAKFVLLGDLVRTNDISTIWVLTGDREQLPWVANRDHWLGEIVGLLTKPGTAERAAMEGQVSQFRARLKDQSLNESGVIVWPLKAPPPK